MPSDLITIKARSKTGQVIDIQVSEIIEIDGQLYRPADETQQIRQLVNHLSGRVSTLEAIVAGATTEMSHG